MSVLSCCIRRPLASLALLAVFFHVSGARSAQFDLGGGWRLALDTTLNYSAQWRVVDPDENKLEIRSGDDIVAFNNKINADDGSLNFDKGLVQNKATALVDLDLRYEDYGIFARGKAFYDDVYSNDTDHDQRDFLTYNSAELYGGDAGFQEFPNETVDTHKSHIQWLDYFAYATWGLPGDRLLDLRLGRQVINWGEATFYQGINGLQNHIDVIAANSAGVEVKEILLPTGALYGQVDLSAALTFEAYYQYEWLKTELNGVGSFFSTQDFLGPGAQRFLLAFGADPQTGLPTVVNPVPRTPDDRPSDQGQFGMALHWFTPNGDDIGFYFVNAHSKAPSFRLNFPPGSPIPQTYTIEYFENIQGYAASFTTVLGLTNVQGEVSFKVDAPVVDADGNPEKGDLLSAQLGGSHVLEPNALWDDASLVFELAAVDVTSHNSKELRFDEFAAAYSLRFEPSYLNVVPGLDIKVPIFWQHGLQGVVREANMIEDARTMNIVVQGVYLNNFTARVGYTRYLDGGIDNLLTDRDNVEFSVSYSF